MIGTGGDKSPHGSVVFNTKLAVLTLGAKVSRAVPILGHHIKAGITVTESIHTHEHTYTQTHTLLKVIDPSQPKADGLH